MKPNPASHGRKHHIKTTLKHVLLLKMQSLEDLVGTLRGHDSSSGISSSHVVSGHVDRDKGKKSATSSARDPLNSPVEFSCLSRFTLQLCKKITPEIAFRMTYVDCDL